MSEQFTAAAKTAAAYFADLDYAKVDAGNSIQSVGGGFTLQSHLAKAFGGGDTKKKIGNFELLIGGEFSGDGGREVFAKALGCHSLHVRHMLRECGAPKHPFGFIEWDRAPAEVFAELAKRYSEPPDLRGADLSNEWNMLKTKISELDLRGANLSDSRFEESGFHNVDLTEANLSGSQFIGVQFWETDLTEADLSDCFFNGCTLMPGSKAPGANFRDTVAVGLGGGGRADFTGANFRNAIFCYAFLKWLQHARSRLPRGQPEESEYARSQLLGGGFPESQSARSWRVRGRFLESPHGEGRSARSATGGSGFWGRAHGRRRSTRQLAV